MEEKLSGIVLGGVSYGESDKILNIFTLEKGVVSAKIKGVKKAGAKLKFASEPFCFAEFIFSEVSGRRTVIGATLLESFYPIRENIVSKDLFVLSIETLKELCYSNKDEIELLCRFLIFALSLSGYAINFSGCACCGGEIKGKTYFDIDGGCFYSEECFEGRGREINFTTYQELKKIVIGEELTDKPIKPLRLLDYYITNKTEENLSSLKELLKII